MRQKHADALFHPSFLPLRTFLFLVADVVLFHHELIASPSVLHSVASIHSTFASLNPSAGSHHASPPLRVFAHASPHPPRPFLNFLSSGGTTSPPKNLTSECPAMRTQAPSLHRGDVDVADWDAHRPRRKRPEN